MSARVECLATFFALAFVNSSFGNCSGPRDEPPPNRLPGAQGCSKTSQLDVARVGKLRVSALPLALLCSDPQDEDRNKSCATSSIKREVGTPGAATYSSSFILEPRTHRGLRGPP